MAEPAALEAIQLLRLAISDPDCELDRPSERMATDPSLHWLQEFKEFARFVRAQAERDFDASRGGGVGEPWFQEILGPEVHVPGQAAPAANGHRGLMPARLVPARLVPARLVPARLVPARLAPRSWRFYAAGERWPGSPPGSG